MLKTEQRFSFSQIRHLDDAIKGGNCILYSLLYFYYVHAFTKLYSLPVDYTKLNEIFSNRVEKNNIEDLVNQHFNKHEYSPKEGKVCTFVDFDHLLNDQIALQHNSGQYGLSDNLGPYCQLILGEAKNFHQGTFYFLSAFDHTQFDFRHIVCMYLASPTELHFLDANQGVNVIHLPKNCMTFELRETILELIFKHDFLSKLLFNPQSKNLEYKLSIVKNSFVSNRQQILDDIVRDHIINPRYPDSYDKAITHLTPAEKEYLARLKLIIQVIRKDHLDKTLSGKANPNSFFYDNDAYKVEEKNLADNKDRLDILKIHPTKISSHKKY